jgi:glucose-1-phosphate cytidylyltransferase
LEDEDVFLANYSDQLSDFPLPDLIEFHKRKKMIASFVSAKPTHSFHQLEMEDGGYVTRMGVAEDNNYWINAGYMVLNREIFEYIEDGDELVEQPFSRLIKLRKLGTLKWTGFWAAMDTFKDKIMFDRMNGAANRPWEVWNGKGNGH